ncbi:L,D-transpeptidase family protein [Nitrosomonas sp.]|uniref:L,D-transpeptidase family protein n=1 Tax=Nitrosomonas sp. TaxID=42353 RepID=UPI002604128E|nr:L,D-transpeptidase family protein [Nitrosomonas sp.]
MSHNPFRSFLLIFQFFCYFVFLLTPSISQALTIEAKALEQQLAKPASFAFTETATANLQQFYNARNYRPVWITPEPESSSLEMAFAFIASAENEGLNSQDYHLQQLQQLQQQAKQSLPAAIELELRTTHAVMQLAKDLSRGRLSAIAADPDWHIPQPKFDAATFLHGAIKTGRLQQSLHDLSPQKHGYQLLKQTLMRYQNLINSHAEWIHIPSTPSIRPGATDTVIPLIRQRIAQAYAADGIAEYHLTSSNSQQYDDALVAAIKAYQIQHGLNPDGIIGKNTIRALNIPLAWKIRQLRINMERLRWLPGDLGKRYVLVNTAGFRLTAAAQGENILSMRIIVGRDYRSTPSFNGALSHMVLNPYWNVPASIARKDLLPKQQKDPDFFTAGGFKIYPSHSRDATALDPDTIDWHGVKKGFPYVLRQDPGAGNALGRIKFMFANGFDIYLHDTPSKSLFQKDIRTFSSGCIRLEKPLELAAFLMGGQTVSDKFLADMDSGKTMAVHLPKQLPIYLVYITAWVDEQDQVHFSPDIYGRDLRALQYAGW